MADVLVLLDGRAARGVIIARIKAQVLWRFLRIGALDDDGFNRGFQEFRVMHIRAIDGDTERTSLFVANQTALRAIFRAIRRIGADFIPPKRALVMAPSALCQSQPTPPASSHSAISKAKIASITPSLFHR